MSDQRDPFDKFREAREREGYVKRRKTDRAVYAGRIARVLGGNDHRKGPAADALPPDRSEIDAAMDRVYGELEAGSPERRIRLAHFLTQLKAAAERLAAESGPSSGEDLEVEMNLNDLFEFMLNPDPSALKG